MISLQLTHYTMIVAQLGDAPWRYLSRHCDRGEGRDLASSALVCLSLFFLVVSSQEFSSDADHGGRRHARPNDNCYRDGTPRPSALRRNCYYCRYRQSTPPTIVAHALVVQVTAAAARKILHSLTPSQFLIDRSHGCYLQRGFKELEREGPPSSHVHLLAAFLRASLSASNHVHVRPRVHSFRASRASATRTPRPCTTMRFDVGRNKN